MSALKGKLFLLIPIAIDPEIRVNILTNEYLKADLEHKLIIIQKFLKGYKGWNTGRRMKEEAEKSQKISSSSENTLARATNQQELLKMMAVEKAEIDQENIKIEGKSLN